MYALQVITQAARTARRFRGASIAAALFVVQVGAAGCSGGTGKPEAATGGAAQKAGTANVAPTPVVVQQRRATKPVSFPDSAEQLLFGARVVLTDRGVSRATVTADSAFSYSEGTHFDLRHLTTAFLSSVGVPNGGMTAQRGRFFVRTSRLDAKGGVVVQSLDGRKLQSEFVTFDPARNIIRSDSAFAYSEPGGSRRTGVGFESDPQLRNVRALPKAGGKPASIPAAPITKPAVAPRVAK